MTLAHALLLVIVLGVIALAVDLVALAAWLRLRWR